MKGFIVLCVIATALAAPQYSYEQGSKDSSGNGGNAGNNGGQGTGGLGNGGLGNDGFNGLGNGLGGGQSGNIGLGNGGLQSPVGPTLWNKQYFIHSAPEDADGEGSSDQSNQITNKKNLRVVIIKAPENKGLENAALQLAKSAGEDRTAIYVLAKQTDLSELQNKLSQIQDQNAHKPEVHFIKYKTPEEAAHAQRTIQDKYNQSFQGPTSVSNEGIAPSSSVVGALGQTGPAYDINAAKGARTQNGYLPPITFFRRI